MILSMIVAYAKNEAGDQVIGKDNALPWKIKQDMVWFREQTSNSAIVMGRKTFESIGRVLPKRLNIIVTKDPEYKAEGAHVFADLDAALSFACASGREVFIIGGQSLYEQCLDRVDRIYVTFIKGKKYEGDAFFPKWNRPDFKPIQKEKSEDEENGTVNYTIFQRIKFTNKQVDPMPNSTYNITGMGM
jgi:dihydrofolate reductase